MLKVAVAMSGGVDSSVTAALLKEEGYEVFGVTMRVKPLGEGLPDETDDAVNVARVLRIPHEIVDLRDVFNREVIADFCEEYSKGRTPNPCVRCNRHIKFGALLDWARDYGTDLLATGHYARIEKSGERFLLKKNRDSNKDQSYFLYRLTQDQLKRAMMPLGSYTKEKGRQLAHELHLPVADKRESQEICFISDNDYRAFVARQIPLLTKSGPITDRAGNLLGEHHGIIDYTIGQRHGLGIAAKEPLYVLEVDSKRNAVIVGSKKQVYADEMIVSEVNWIACDEPQHPLAGKVKIRYRHKESSALLTPLHDGNVRIRFEQPQMAITPGQSAVFYRDDVVLGGGTIMGQG